MLTITSEELLSLRERLHLSRPVFARFLRTNERTLENWEQGRARPNAQAALLIRLVEYYPDTVVRLSAIKVSSSVDFRKCASATFCRQ